MQIRNFINLFVLLIAITLCTQTVYSQENMSKDAFDSLIEEAVNNNPSIQEAYGQWQAAVYQARQASSLPDPMVKYGYFGENVETRVGPQEHKYGISQKIPFPAKLILKRKSDVKHAEMLNEKYEAVKNEIIKRVKYVYYDLYWVDKAIQVTEEEKAILETLEKVAQRKYETKFAPQQDVVKAQVELSMLIKKLLLLRQHRESLVAKLNSLLNRINNATISIIEEVKPEELRYKLSELHEMSEESRQELLVARLNIERAEYEKSLAMMDYFPDVTLGFDYVQVGEGQTMSPDDGQDAWIGSIAFNIPLWFGRISDKVKEKKLLLESSKQGYEGLRNDIYYEIEDIFFKIHAYNDVINLYKTALIPQTEQAFDAAKTGYETGKVDFLNWLESERVLLQTRLAYYKTIVDYQKSIAYLERVVGKDLQEEK